MSCGRIRSASCRLSAGAQAGLTLVELLVAMVIGLFLVGGVATMYLSSFQSYRVLKQNARIAQRERLAATYVGAIVQSAGYYNQPILKRTRVFPETSNPHPGPPFRPFSNDGQFLLGSDGTYVDAQGDTRQKDTLQLRMRMEAGEHVLNCWGDGGDSDERIYVNALILDTVEKQIECALWKEEYAGSGKLVKASAQNQQPILNGVVSLAFTYGVDTDGNGSADQYLAASHVADWLSVRSIVMNIGFAANNAATGNANIPAEPVMFRAVFPVRIDS